jgi:hypothetical protein
MAASASVESSMEVNVSLLLDPRDPASTDTRAKRVMNVGRIGCVALAQSDLP